MCVFGCCDSMARLLHDASRHAVADNALWHVSLLWPSSARLCQQCKRRVHWPFTGWAKTLRYAIETERQLLRCGPSDFLLCRRRKQKVLCKPRWRRLSDQSPRAMEQYEEAVNDQCKHNRCSYVVVDHRCPQFKPCGVHTRIAIVVDER